VRAGDWQELDAAYKNALVKKMWGNGYVGSYAMSNHEEYFAAGLQVTIEPIFISSPGVFR